MEQLKQMKQMLTSCVQGQLSHLDTVDTKELGEAIDMIKDLSEAVYYCTITEAMEEKEKQPYMENRRHYSELYYPEWEYYRDMDKMKGRMYYGGHSGTTSGATGGNSSVASSTSSHGNGTRYYTELEMPIMRDHREGRSPMIRKNYMESKEMHKDKAFQMQELEKYSQELLLDVMEMIEGASPEEKQLLSNKIATLATKIK